MRRLLPVLLLGGLACGGPAPDGSAAPGEPIPNLSEDQLAQFLLGKALFSRLTAVEEGLGPLFNETRCSACHDQPTSGGGGSGDALVRKATRFADGACDPLVAQGGDNFQRRATDLLAAEGITGEVVPDAATGVAMVTGPSLYGLGLVDAIAEEDIAAGADPDDADGDGISGRVGRTGDGRPGRFGRKGEVETLEEFVDTALRFELGLTTHLHPREETVNGEPLPAGVDPMPEPEIDERGLIMLTQYVRFLAPPARESPSSEAARDTIARGEALFGEIGCADCHRPAFVTPPAAGALANYRVPLYSDLLLHDLGPALADVCGPAASPAEYRTVRLWGLRHRTSFLHDGRAATPDEAILHHDGEAAAARTAFAGLDAAARAALLRFLNSL